MDELPRDEGRRVDRPSRVARRRRVRRQRLVAAGAFVAVVCLLGVGAWALLNGGADVAAGEGGERAGSATGGGTPPISPSASPPGASGSSSPSPSPSATGTPAGGAAASADTVIEIGWVGDTTPGSKYGTPPNGGRALFTAMRRDLRAPDLMIANLEGTYSTAGPSKCDGVDSDLCFAFQAPPAYAKALSWSGIDLVNLANNHTYDYFQRGLDQTAAALKEAGVAYTGLPGKITRVRVRGVRVAVVGFAPYSWCPNVNDIAGAVRLVERAARRADVVVVLMHAGAEGADKIHTPKGAEVAFGEQRGNSRVFAHAVINAGADLVLGSGPHVIRGIEQYRGRLVAYSLGNFAGWGNFGLGGNLSLSGLLTARVDAKGRIRGGRWLSVTLAGPGVPRVDSTHAAARLVRQLSAVDFAKTYELDAKGSFSAGENLAPRRPATLDRRAP